MLSFDRARRSNSLFRATKHRRRVATAISQSYQNKWWPSQTSATFTSMSTAFSRPHRRTRHQCPQKSTLNSRSVSESSSCASTRPCWAWRRELSPDSLLAYSSCTDFSTKEKMIESHDSQRPQSIRLIWTAFVWCSRSVPVVPSMSFLSNSSNNFIEFSCYSNKYNIIIVGSLKTHIIVSIFLLSINSRANQFFKDNRRF